MAALLHIAVSFETIVFGCGSTVIITVSDDAHLVLPIPVTTYLVVADGVAIGFGLSGSDNPALGDHMKDVPCVTFICTGEPAQTVVSSFALISDRATVICTLSRIVVFVAARYAST